jgi:stage V sporulation protein R
MEIISQHTKKIMEECKIRAREAGLAFDNETLEYIVSNRDMVELSPKVMIPTLYDYWVNDVEVLKGMGKYKLYPNNPFETVINTRPAISFYNDNNPDWMNIMIFYHVIAHIDFFQNNCFFKNTWNDDFAGQALADKRLIALLRSRHGRWVDYVIEFSRNIDNICGYYSLLARKDYQGHLDSSPKVQYYFDVFLQEEIQVPKHELYKQVHQYNELIVQNKSAGEGIFFSEIKLKHPEFEAMFEKYRERDSGKKPVDLLEFIMQESPFLKKEKNLWMKLVMSVVRNTALYFEPQIRTKTINEGWASYWHDKLFRNDERIQGHEVAYARLNASVTSISRAGLNPYAIGLRLIEHVEEMADKGKLNFEFQKIENIEQRKSYDSKVMQGQEAIFHLRRNFSDFVLFNTFVDQDFTDKHDLFVLGQRLNQQQGLIEYYVKSRKAIDYKNMLIDSLYHPPKIETDLSKTNEENLYLRHRFENKQLVKDFISDTMMGIAYLWDGQVQLETTEIVVKKGSGGESGFEFRPVLYTMKNKKLNKENL